MVQARWETSMSQNSQLQPDIYGLSVELNRFYNTRLHKLHLRDIAIPDNYYPFYLTMRRDGSIYYNLGAYCWMIPTTRHLSPTYSGVWDNGVEGEDFEAVLRNVEWCAKTQSSGFLLKLYNQQLQVSRTMAVGEYFYLQSCVWAGFSIFYNICRGWNVKLWFPMMAWSCMAHYIYRKVFMCHPIYRYRHARWKGRGMFRIGVIGYLMSRKNHVFRWENFVVKRQGQLLISEKKVHNRLKKMRKFCIIAFLLALYRLYTDEDLVLVSKRIVPRSPYPWNAGGSATGYWLKAPGTAGAGGVGQPVMQKWGESGTILNWFGDNVMGYVGAAVTLSSLACCCFYFSD